MNDLGADTRSRLLLLLVLLSLETEIENRCFAKLLIAMGL